MFANLSLKHPPFQIKPVSILTCLGVLPDIEDLFPEVFVFNGAAVNQLGLVVRAAQVDWGIPYNFPYLGLKPLIKL